MNRRVTARGALVLLVVAAMTFVVGPLGAQTVPPPIAVELLTPRAGGVFTDNIDITFRHKLDGSERDVIRSDEPGQLIVARITVQPGAQFPWHTHPGPVLVNVTQGELIYVRAVDCVERSYPEGNAFIDPGRDNIHTAFNPTGGETVVVAAFFEVPPAGPLTIPVDAPSECTVEGGVVASHHQSSS